MCLEQMLRNADHSALDTEYFQEKIWILNGWISRQELAGIRHQLTSIGFCHLCTCFALITFLILFILLLLSNSIRHDPKSEASL